MASIRAASPRVFKTGSMAESLVLQDDPIPEKTAVLE
jgi:hypothetical protein